MNPCITTWPAYVPTLELDRPGREQRDRERERRAAADQLLEAGVRALDRVDVGVAALVEQRRGDDEHRQVDHARPAPIAIPTSTRWKRSSERRSASSRGGIRPCTSALCR